MGSELTFSESDLTPEPIELFSSWLKLAEDKSALNDPNAMCLSTVDPNGYPDSRMVLLKSYDKSGFVFFTNSLSRKGISISKVPKASLNFFWDSLRRQVRIQGDVERVSPEESDRYFSTRSKMSQLGAWASLQSEKLESREIFLERIEKYKLSFQKEVPRPPHWLGYRVKPIEVEFWQERDNRLHDRFVYRRSGDNWTISRLYP